MRILNFGSLNIDRVYRVPHVVRPGETLASLSQAIFAGGKGANQSVALARAGAAVAHAGRVGHDGQWLVEKLRSLGVDPARIEVDPDTPTGHAVIQVDDRAQNAIVLFPGANHAIDAAQIDRTVAGFDRGDWLLVQNETSNVPRMIETAHARGLRVAFNPAPCDQAVRRYPLDRVDLLIVNETECRELAGVDDLDDAARMLCRHGGGQVIVTLGSDGVCFRDRDRSLRRPAMRVEPVDTTAAGDTFIGFYLAGQAAGLTVEASLDRAVVAAALCVTRPGAMDAIPSAAEVDARL